MMNVKYVLKHKGFLMVTDGKVARHIHLGEGTSYDLTDKEAVEFIKKRGEKVVCPSGKM